MTPSDDSQIPQDAGAQSSNPNGILAFQTLGDYLKEDEWYPRRMEGKYAFTMGFTGRNGDLRCYAIIHPDLEEFLFYAVAPIKVPEEVRSAASEFITRANYGMRIGNLEMDYSDGEVRYKSSLNFEDEPLTPGMLRNTIYPCVHTLDRYLPGLLRVSFGGATPLEAIEEIEGPAAPAGDGEDQ